MKLSDGQYALEGIALAERSLRARAKARKPQNYARSKNISLYLSKVEQK